VSCTELSTPDYCTYISSYFIPQGCFQTNNQTERCKNNVDCSVSDYVEHHCQYIGGGSPTCKNKINGISCQYNNDSNRTVSKKNCEKYEIL
jgi:hypothetical protein